MGQCSAKCTELASAHPESQHLLAYDEVEVERELAQIPDWKDLTDTVLQFSTTIYHCSEDEKEVKVDVTRLGHAEFTSVVDFYTEDGSAQAGRRYVATTGSLVFRPNETVQPVRVLILEDRKWDATLDFRIKLTNVRGGTLGQYLHTCQVKVIDNDFFPTNKFRNMDHSNMEAVASIPSFQLFIEYIRMNTKDEDIWRLSKNTVVADNLKNVYFFVQLYLQVYLIDVVLGGEEEHEAEGEGEIEVGGGEGEFREERRRLHGGEEGLIPLGGLWVPGHRGKTAALVGALYIAPFMVLQIVDLMKVSWMVAGRSRRVLQANLLRKFLNYTERVRSRISAGDVSMCMMRDIREVVDCGYMKVFEVVRITGKLLSALVFILAENKMAVIPLAIYPVVMLCFLKMRERITTEANERAAEEQNQLVHSVNDNAANFRLIADYFLRSFIVETFDTKVQQYNGAEAIAARIGTNNNYLSPWLTTMLIGGYIMLGVHTTTKFGGEVSLGTFLATINVFKEIGMELQEIYKELLEIQRSFGPLAKVTYYMNLSTDLRARKEHGKRRLEEGFKEWGAKRALAMSGLKQWEQQDPDVVAPFPVDSVNISLRNVGFSHSFDAEAELEARATGAKLSAGPDRSVKPLFANVNLEFEQGKVYAFIGLPRAGRSTFLKLLAQVEMPSEGEVFVPPHMRVLHIPVEMPSEGEVFVPPHMRVLHIPVEPYFLAHSLKVNLTLGSSGADLQRACQICRRLGLPEKMCSAVAAPEEFHSDKEEYDDSIEQWGGLSHSDRARVTLARAFIYNPEMLVVHKPAMAFPDDEVAKVYALIRAHVEERGLELPGGKARARRRPRTVFFSAVTQLGVAAADMVYEVKHGTVTLLQGEGIVRNLPTKGGPNGTKSKLSVMTGVSGPPPG
eukprot:gnl/TRDRNA2_/TRDRNA2_160841_c0_seq1.p1 gnl/TRDRNA2_/TRDRNA2_160841_c0~~gnl/TRDRNA2_/TRDRNA2_160841_c0_seq1.p1  ORF type:complete len:902 (+),score=160.81 gnl/TRDRNA2_/TRDRNA2_160841_c0_seq1:85-2790(+)